MRKKERNPLNSTPWEKFCYSMTGTLRAIGKRFDQCGSVSFSAGTAIENDNLLGHGVFPP